MKKTRYEELLEERLELGSDIHEGMDDGQADAISDAMTSLEEDMKPYEHVALAITALKAQASPLRAKVERLEGKGAKVDPMDYHNLNDYEATIEYFQAKLRQ